EFGIFHSICGFLHYVSPDEKKRKASFMADLLLSKHGNELNLRKDIYNKLIEINKINDENLDNEDRKFLEKLISSYERNGINLEENIRKRIETIYSEKFNDILNDIVRLIVLRDKHSKILNYNCHGDYKAHHQMTKNSTNIKNFLIELLQKLDYRYRREIDSLFKIKEKEDCKVLQLNSWDILYYINKWKQEYGIDELKLNKYFELNNTLKKLTNKCNKINIIIEN